MMHMILMVSTKLIRLFFVLIENTTRFNFNSQGKILMLLIINLVAFYCFAFLLKRKNQVLNVMNRLSFVVDAPLKIKVKVFVQTN